MNNLKETDTLDLIDDVEAVPRIDVGLIDQFINRMEWTMENLKSPDPYYSRQYCKSLYALVEYINEILTSQVDVIQELTERALSDDEIMGWLRGSK